MELNTGDAGKWEIGEGVMELPLKYTKGLEFDAVLIFNASEEDYPVEDGYVKQLYVAATRALHELTVLPGETHRTDRRSGIPRAEAENAPCRRCPEEAGENGGKTGRAGEDKRRDLQTEGTGSGKGTCGQRALRPKEDHRDKKQSGDNRRRYTEESRKVRGT
ncbi:UvrD/Rep helicase family protein [human gut metagenome]|uniref:UvrD/Rep helicase family protein n=1 Tax=human gut metagenome TaxID=408170 RepID=K1RTU1_9ZZZZ